MGSLSLFRRSRALSLQTCLVALSFAALFLGPGGAPAVTPDSQEPSPPAAPGAAQEAPKPVPLTLDQRADLHMARKDYADAVDDYRRALKEPNLTPAASASLWNRLGIAFQQQMEFNRARAAYREAMRQRDDFAEAWNNFATTYFLEKKYRKSIKYFLHALKLNPSSATYHMNVGTAYYHLKRYPKCVEEYGLALDLDPNVFYERSTSGTVMQAPRGEADYFFYLSKAFARGGHVDESVRFLRRALEDGFKDNKRIQDDPDLQKISQAPAFIELMKNPPVPIKE